MSEPPTSDTPPSGTEMLRDVSQQTDREVCAGCGGWRPARAEFCETCGAGADGDATIAVDVFADREYFDTLDAAGLSFPATRRARTLRFHTDVINIGRRRTDDGARVDVDLSGDLADPGASARHARLVRAPDGRWELIDVGSTNGTTVNESTAPIEPDERVEIAVGDHIHVGAWTTIVIRATRPLSVHDDVDRPDP